MEQRAKKYIGTHNGSKQGKGFDGTSKGETDPKILAKLELRNKALQHTRDHADSQKKRSSVTLAGSLKKGGGW